MTRVSGVFRTTLTYAAAVPRSTGVGDTRIAARIVPPRRQPTSVTPKSDSVPQVPLRNIWMSSPTGLLLSPWQVLTGPDSVSVAGRLLATRGVAARVLERLRPGAVLHRCLEGVVDRVAQRVVVLGQADTVGLLRERVPCDLELPLVLRGVAAEDRVVGRDRVDGAGLQIGHALRVRVV